MPAGSERTPIVRTEVAARWPNLGQHAARNPEDLEQLVVPVAGCQVVELGSRRVGGVAGVHGAAGQVPEHPAVDRAGTQLTGGARARGRSGIASSSQRILLAENSGSIVRPVFCSIVALQAAAPQLVAERRRPAALPDDAGAERTAGAAVPDQHGLALVGDGDDVRRQRRRGEAGLDRRPRRCARARPDPAPPSRLRERDRDRPRRARHHAAGVVEQQHLRVRRALVDREDVRGAPCSVTPARGRGPRRECPRRRGRSASSRKLAEPVGANTPGTPSMRMRVGCDSTTTSATALPKPPYTVCSSTVTIGPRRRLGDALAIDGPNRRQIEHGRADAVLLQQPRGLERARHGDAGGDERHVGAVAQQRRPADLERTARRRTRPGPACGSGAGRPVRRSAAAARTAAGGLDRDRPARSPSCWRSRASRPGPRSSDASAQARRTPCRSTSRTASRCGGCRRGRP